MGFRSYIREFLVAILMLFRPSGPCCLGVAEALFLSLESSVAKIWRGFGTSSSFRGTVFSPADARGSAPGNKTEQRQWQ